MTASQNLLHPAKMAKNCCAFRHRTRTAMASTEADIPGGPEPHLVYPRLDHQEA